MSSPQRRVSVSVNSVLSSLATSPETKNSWIGALRILSSVMTSQQQQQKQLINQTSENPKLIAPIALSLQCWMRNGRKPSDFSLLLFTPSSSSQQWFPSSPVDYILTSLELLLDSNKLEDAKTICNSLLTKTKNESNAETILNIFVLKESEKSRISQVLSKLMEMEASELAEKTKNASTNPHELDLVRFSVFLETLLAVNKTNGKITNDNNCHATILENISIAILSDRLQKPLSQASLLQLVSGADNANNSEGYSRNAKISESMTTKILSMIWDFTMLIIVNPSSSSKISDSTKQIMKFIFKNIPSISHLESFAVKMDRDLQTKLSSSSSSSSIKKSILADEEMLVFILDQYSRFAIDSNNTNKHRINNENYPQPQILKLANSLFPHVARSSLIYAATLRALRSQGMWQEAIRFGENASEFVTGDDDDTISTTRTNNKIRPVRQGEKADLSSRMKMLIKNHNARNLKRYSINHDHDDDVVESTVSDLTDHILATNNTNKTERQNQFSSGNNNNNKNIDNDISSSESIGEVIRAALNARRWDAALMILKRIVHNNNNNENNNDNSHQHHRQQRIIQLDPTLVASVVRSIPQISTNQYQQQKSFSTQTQNNVILDLAQCAEKVPFFAPMVTKMLQELGERDEKHPNGKNNKSVMTNPSSSSWESALIHLRAMAIANGTLVKVANQKQDQDEECAQASSSVLSFTSPQQDAIANLIDRGMIRLATVLLEHHCSFVSDEIQITRIFLTSLLQKQPKRYVQNNNNISASSIQPQTEDEKTKQGDWNALIDVLLAKISSSKIKIELSATSILLHLIMLRTLEGKSHDLNNFIMSGTDTNEQMFNMQVRAVVASVRKVGKTIDLRKELPWISNRQDSYSLSINLGLLQGLIEINEKQADDKKNNHNNSLLFSNVELLLGNINEMVENFKGDSNKILMTSAELMANVMRKILGLINASEQCSNEITMQTKTAFSRFFEIVSQKLLTTGGESEKEFATKFITSPACSIQLILEVLRVVTSDQNENEILDESLISILSSRNSPSFFSRINNNLKQQQHHSLTEEDEELLKSVLMKVISNRVLGVATESTKQIPATTISRRNNNTWFEAASLVSQAWRLDGVPPQKMMTSMLMMQQGNQFFYQFPRLVVAQWEHEYRKVCAVTSPSLLMAFGHAQMEQDKKQDKK